MSYDAPHVLFCRCLRRRTDEDWQRFQTLYGRRLRWLIRAECRSMGCSLDTDAVDDLTQELYLSLLTRSAFSGHSAAALWTYLRVSVRNRLIDRQRRATTRKRSPVMLDSTVQHRSFRAVGSGSAETSSAPPQVEDRLVDTPRSAPRPAVSSVSLNRHTEPQAYQRLLQRDLRRWLVIRCRRAFLLEAEARGQPVDVGRRRLLFAAIGLTLLVGYTSREASVRLGGQPLPGEIDRLVSRLRKEVALEGIELPRR